MAFPHLDEKASPGKKGRRNTLLAAALIWAGGFAAPLLADDVSPSSSSEFLKGLSLEELLQLQVTSVSRRPEKLTQAPSAVQVISSADIARSTATTLPEALRLANNLDIAQKNPHDWAVSARGFNANVGNKLLVLVDGRSVYTPLFAGVFWNAQDYILADIDRIEVISGPGGTLWGANAVNGVININTKNAGDTQGLYFDTAVGDELQTATSVRYGGKLAPNVYFRVYGKFFSEDDGVLPDGRRASDDWHQGQSGFRLDAETAQHDVLTLQGDVYGGDLEIQTGETARIAGGNILGRWSRALPDDSNMSLQFYVDRTHLADPFAASPFAPAGFLKDNLDTYDLDFQDSLLLAARHRIVWGVGYRFTHDDVLQQAPNVAYLPPELDRSLYSAFFQDEFRIRPDLAFTVGSKIEHNDYTGFEFEPNVRLQWDVTPKQMAWAAISRAVRMPSRFDRDLYEPAPPQSLIAGGPHFVSETVIAYEAGYRAQLESHLSGSVALFYNDYDRLRSWGATPVTVLPIVFENNLTAHTYGLELNLDLQAADWWRLNAGYNLLEERVRLKAGRFDLQNALDETADPENQFSLRSMMDLPGRVEFDTAFRWVDTLHNNNGGLPGTVPAYAELDVRIGWHLGRDTELALMGRNLLHDYHPEYGPPGPAREELQRSLFAKITWRY